MANQVLVETMVGMGCRSWSKNGIDRVYVPVAVACRIIGLHVSRYGSGNVSAATLAGEKISNSTAREMLSGLDGLYYDVNADKFVGQSYGAAKLLRERAAGELAGQ